MSQRNDSKSVHLALWVVKPFDATWLIVLYKYMKDNPTIIVNSFKKFIVLTNDNFQESEE